MDNTDGQNRLRWTGPMFNREPVWSKEPDIAVINTLAQKHLRDILTDDDHGSIRVDFFAQGAFNKLYEITCGQHAQRFIFRVSLSLDPFFKVESEVATMEFLSGFPVPRVIAWDSDSRTELGFEWLLMELIDGVPLCDVWRQIPWERKVTLTEEISKIVVKIETYTFDSIGSLYNSSSLQSRIVPEGADASQLETLRSTPGSSTKWADTEDFTLRQMKADVPVPEEFALSSKSSVTGHMVAPIFITESRLELPANRGPFQNSLEWMRAAIEIQLEWINKGLSLLGSKRDDVDPGYDSDLEDEAPEMKDLCHGYLELIPQIFAEETRGHQFVLHHHDLNAANIIVDPTTFKVTGIVDWEMTCVVPRWKAAVEPVFLEDADFDWETGEPPIPPSYDMDKDQYTIEARDRWDYKQLRQHYNTTRKQYMKELGYVDEVDPEEAKLKRDVERQIFNLTEDWTSAKYWLKKYQNGGVAPPDSDASSEDDEPSRESGDEESGVKERGVQAHKLGQTEPDVLAITDSSRPNNLTDT